MKRFILGGVALLSIGFLFGQKQCGSFGYQNQLTQADPSILVYQKTIENFLLAHTFSSAKGQQVKIITIPVIVHILYHFPGENISDDVVRSQVSALNRDFRKQNADTTKIPSVFKSLAADCGIEFRLATVDPEGRSTPGTIHKYTPITIWTMDDKIKSSLEMGDDPWDPKNYLNIWVGSLESLIGYSSIPGDPANKDGIVISNSAFGITNSGIYDQGRTAVHEIGHWLGLRHLWGDADCGDDGIADTPMQQTFTNGCPTGVRISCDNGPNGDMYMDYMDFTNDDCLVMFTEGQKERMLSLFDPGGPRYSFRSSNGLGLPTTEETPLPNDDPKWLHVKIYPNPAHINLTVNMEFDPRWVGKELVVLNVSGQVVIKKIITSKTLEVDISRLKPGVYFLTAEKAGDRIREKFVKF
ncbi:MAG TPA: M43 family zinc metalloprotease [Chitinophagaceae bacterium]|nr:M43 family zinc metalloprotease [Chitinophagaceae bacterium]